LYLPDSQIELLESRREALHGAEIDIFKTDRVPDKNTLVKWDGLCDEADSM
jgi:hypothetical protein